MGGENINLTIKIGKMDKVDFYCAGGRGQKSLSLNKNKAVLWHFVFNWPLASYHTTDNRAIEGSTSSKNGSPSLATKELQHKLHLSTGRAVQFHRIRAASLRQTIPQNPF